MAPLLYVCVRPELGAADAEHSSFRRALGVDDLDRLNLLDESPTDATLLRYQGIVVGGSPFNVTDANKTIVQQRVEADLERIAHLAIDERLAAFFTCYGIGVVTRMLGGTVTTDHPESASAAVIDVTSAGASDAVFGPSTPALTVFTAHKESSAFTPPGAELLATNRACPVQAYRVGRSLYAAQFHPEPTPQDFADRMTFYRTTGYFDADEFDLVQRQVLASRVSGTDLLRRFGEVATGESYSAPPRSSSTRSRRYASNGM